MKQYTTPDQTAKLIELGLPKPWYYSTDKYTIIHTGFEIINYSIGELIGMLPISISHEDTLYDRVISKNEVCYYSWIFEVYFGLICDEEKELIDNLYNMIVYLKETSTI